ncbi:hypothetical protein AB1285_21620 [Microbacterium sp. NRRL B-14842]
MMYARHRRIARLTAPLLISVFLLSACSAAEEEPTPTPTAADGSAADPR